MMVVRDIDPASDLPAVRALWRATWSDTYGPMLGADRTHLIDAALAAPGVSGMLPSDGGALAAVADGEIVASACFAERHGTGYLWGMYCHPRRQRRGYGSALLRAAARAMPRAVTLEVITVTPGAAAFYRRLGFAEVGTSTIEVFQGAVWAAVTLDVAAATLRDGA